MSALPKPATTAQPDAPDAPSFPVQPILGSRLHMVQVPDVVDTVGHWIEHDRDRCHMVVNTGMHGVIEAHRNAELKAILNSAELFTPDGISVIWISRLRGHALPSRVNAAKLMLATFAAAERNGWSSFFYGDTDETLALLEKNLLEQFPRLRIAGLHSPPFRRLSEEEDEEIIRRINDAKPDILWVALGLPKQERWIHERKSRLRVPAAFGIGAGFKFLSGQVSRAPEWVGEHGFEWLWRLFQEPRTTWRRVFIDGPHFLTLVALELLGLRKFR